MCHKHKTSKMKIRKLLACSVLTLLAAGVSVQAAEMTKYYAKSGSKMRMEGTSNIHDWQVEGTLIRAGPTRHARQD
jgi:hypothetical protein